MYKRTAALSLLSRAGGTTLPRGGPMIPRGGTRLPSGRGTTLPGSNAAFYNSVKDPVMREVLHSLISETSRSPAAPKQTEPKQSAQQQSAPAPPVQTALVQAAPVQAAPTQPAAPAQPAPAQQAPAQQAPAGKASVQPAPPQPAKPAGASGASAKPSFGIAGQKRAVDLSTSTESPTSPTDIKYPKTTKPSDDMSKASNTTDPMDAAPTKAVDPMDAAPTNTTAATAPVASDMDKHINKFWAAREFDRRRRLGNRAGEVRARKLSRLLSTTTRKDLPS